MPVAAAYILTASEFLDDDLLGTELVGDLGDDLSSSDGGAADCRATIATGDQENLGEDQRVAARSFAIIDLNTVSLADPELMATVLNNGVHRSAILLCPDERPN